MSYAGRRRFFRHGGGSSSGFTLTNDLVTGWTDWIPKPVDTTTVSRIHISQPGSRMYFISRARGDDTTGQVYFWDGTLGAIVDQNGSPTNPSNGLAYGTDPLLPNDAAIQWFKHWGYVGPRYNPATDYGTFSAGTRVGWVSGTGALRDGKPDAWLFRRGEGISLYEDLRETMDAANLATTPMWGSSALRTAGGFSSTYRSAILACGPTTDGRAWIYDSMYTGFIAQFGGSSNMAYTLISGLFIDGSKRNVRLRPPDWIGVTPNWTGLMESNDSNMTGVVLRGYNPAQQDLVLEDLLIYKAAGVDVQFDPAYSGNVAGVTFRRSLALDGYSDGAVGRRAQARKGPTDPDQTLAANTTATVTWPTVTSGTWVSNAWTGVIGVYYKVWVLMDVLATVDVGGTVETVLFVNGVETASHVLPGTGKVGGDTYRVSAVLYTGKLAGSYPLEVRLRTTSATGTVTITGANGANVRIHSLSSTSINGISFIVHGTAKVDCSQNIIMRMGFNVDPDTQSTPIPNGTNPRFDWDIRNHNFYCIGDNTDTNWTNVKFEENVSMIGAAGDLFRLPCKVNRNFFYNGYVSMVPEHLAPYTISIGQCDDNVLQRFRATTGASNAHPAWGFQWANGLKNFSFQRNVISDVMVDGFGSFGVAIGSMSTPYYKPYELYWVNDTAGTLVNDNIIDSTGADNTYDVPIREANGGNDLMVQWHAPITGMTKTSTAGTVLTCTPDTGYSFKPGFTQPGFQWHRYKTIANTRQAVVTGATASTYTMIASAAVITVGSPDISVPAHGYIAGQGVMFETTGALPTGLTARTTYYVLNAGLTADTFRVCLVYSENSTTGAFIDGATITPSGTQSGTHTCTQDYGYDASYGGYYHRFACEVSGIVFPPGYGITGTTVTNNIVVKPAAKPLNIYWNQNSSAGPGTAGGTEVFSTVPATSDIVIGAGNAIYTSRSLVPGWTNPNASTKTYLQSLGITVNTVDGLKEYRDTVVGSNPVLTAMRRGMCDSRFFAIKMGNEVRTGRGKAAL